MTVEKNPGTDYDTEKNTTSLERPRAGSLENPEGLSYNPDTGRESDFLTRNGLNLKSFERRRSRQPIRFCCATAF